MTSSPNSIPELIQFAAQAHAGRTAIEENGLCTDYRELPHLALGVTRSLMALGIRKGDRVAIWAPNGRDWIIAALGIHCAGAVMVPINTRMKGNEAADILHRSGTRLLFVQPDFLGIDYLALLAPHRPIGLEQLVKLGDANAWDTFLSLGAAISEEDAQARAASVGAQDLSDLLFTSGTTGKPKGVMSAHGQNIRAFSEYVKVIGLVAGDRYLVINPFFHAFEIGRAHV